MTGEQERLLSRAADLEAEQREHAAAAAEAARIAAAAAARAAELEAQIQVEVTERRSLLLLQEEVREGGGAVQTGSCQMGCMHVAVLPHWQEARLLRGTCNAAKTNFWK